jgi:hypothetical protein
MERLADDLAREAGRLRDNPDRTVNSLGVVQGRGMDVDRLCALLDERRKSAAKLYSVAPARALIVPGCARPRDRGRVTGGSDRLHHRTPTIRSSRS